MELAFLGVCGSQSFGLADEASDLDLVGFYVPKGKLLYGLSGKSGLERVEEIEFQFEGKKCEAKIHDVRKAGALIARSNPNMVDMLWIDEQFIIVDSPFYRDIRATREKLLTAEYILKLRAYAVGQVKRIESHRRWLVAAASGEFLQKPTRADYGLPEAPMIPSAVYDAVTSIAALETLPDGFHDEVVGLVADEVRLKASKVTSGAGLADYIRAWNLSLTAWSSTVLSLGKHMSPEILAAARAEMKYKHALDDWKAYERWKAERNPLRAVLETKAGFDCKHGSHVIRLLTMAKEAAAGKGLILDRRKAGDHEFLLKLKRGDIPYEEYRVMADKLDAEIEEIRANLPPKYDPSELLVGIQLEHLSNS